MGKTKDDYGATSTTHVLEADDPKVTSAVTKVVAKLREGKAPDAKDLETLEGAQHPTEHKLLGSDAFFIVKDPKTSFTIREAMAELRDRVAKPAKEPADIAAQQAGKKALEGLGRHLSELMHKENDAEHRRHQMEQASRRLADEKEKKTPLFGPG